MTVIREPASGYRWVEPLEAYCFTAVVGLCADEVIDRLGADPSTTALRSFDDCFWAVDQPQWALVGSVGAGVLVAEHNGWRAEEAVPDLSVGARVGCFYRNVHAIMQFSYAEDGAVLARFDPLLQNRPVSGHAPWVLDPLLAGLPFGLFAAEASALCLLERATGIPVTEAWLARPQRAIRLPSLS